MLYLHYIIFSLTHFIAFATKNNLCLTSFNVRKYSYHSTKRGDFMAHRIYTTSFASVYPLYVAKAERKGRTKEEVDTIIRWLTGYDEDGLERKLASEVDFDTFFAAAPKMNEDRTLIKGVVCGVRVENVEEPLMREIRYLDKLVDELAKGKAMEKILRGGKL